jgi:hypothetical protein
MTGPTCDLDGRPVDGTAYVCSPCSDKTRADLLRIVDLAGDVEAAILKLVRYGGAGQGSGERPVPFDDVRAERAAAVGNTLATWARHVAEARGVEIPHRPGVPGAAVVAGWLADQLEWLRHQREAAEAMSDLREAAREVERIVDRPRDRWYAGPAGRICLPAAGARWSCTRCRVRGTVRCPECKAEHDAAARKQWLLDEARDALVHAELMARALTALDIEDVTPARVRGMARHGRLMAKGTNSAGDPTYRVGDVLDVVEEQERIEAERVRRREEKVVRRAERLAASKVA